MPAFSQPAAFPCVLLRVIWCWFYHIQSEWSLFLQGQMVDWAVIAYHVLILGRTLQRAYSHFPVKGNKIQWVLETENELMSLPCATVYAGTVAEALSRFLSMWWDPLGWLLQILNRRQTYVYVQMPPLVPRDLSPFFSKWLRGSFFLSQIPCLEVFLIYPHSF